jgi:hypothetical protein
MVVFYEAISLIDGSAGRLQLEKAPPNKARRFLARFNCRREPCLPRP